ncbi:hypothetical protein BJX62DRAFT_233659 [Aspergillus germanicus]
MSPCASFYPAGPLENLVASPSSLLLSNGFNPEFLNLALLDKRTHRDIQKGSQHSNNPDRTPSIPPSVQSKTTTRRLRSRQLLPESQTNRERSLEGKTIKALLFFQHPSSTNFSNKHDHNPNPDQGLGFDGAPSHHSDLSSYTKSSPTRPGFWRDKVQKREKHLERNRMAASKSRQKKKHETDQLKAQFNKVSRQKQLLEEEVKRLHSDLLYLKDQILMHSQCDDEAIHSYLGRMVEEATKRGSLSSVSMEEEVPQSESPPGTNAQPCQDTEQGLLGIFSPEPDGMLCGVEKPIIDPEIYQLVGSIFDNELSVS